MEVRIGGHGEKSGTMGEEKVRVWCFVVYSIICMEKVRE